ncbi:MAG: hypothetical protein WAT79_01420 [Saprospiraceae bacterium]
MSFGQCEFSLLPTGNSCSSAQYLCGNELDGFTGRLPDTLTVPHPWIGICNYGGSAENVVWFAFTPCQSTVKLRIIPSNCKNNAGVQAGLYRRCGESFSVDCSVDPIPAILGQRDTFYLSWSGFTPGKVAYLVLDGMAGDICDFKIEVVDGVDTTPAEEIDETQLQDGFVVGPNNLDCQQSGDTISYSMILPTCLMNYVESCFVEKINILDSVCFVWNIDVLGSGSYSFVNNDNIGQNVRLILNGTATDAFRISVDVNIHPYYGGGCAKGACGIVEDLYVEFKPDELETTIIEICPNESIDICNTTITGDTIIECKDATNSCKTLRYDVRLKPIQINDIGTIYQCAGEFYEFQGVQYYHSGVFTVPDLITCDLVHRFEVKTVVLNATIQNGIRQLDCNNENINLTSSIVSDFPNDITYEWYDGINLIGSGSTFTIDKPGRYRVVAFLNNNFINCQSSDFVDITLNKDKPVCSFNNPVLDCRIKTGSITYNSSHPLVSEKWSLISGLVVNGTTFPIDSTMAASGVSCRFTAKRADNGCVVDTLVAIRSDFVAPNVSIQGDGELTCLQLSVPLQAVSSLTPEYIRWTLGPNFLVDNTANYTATVKGDYNVFMRASRNGCSNQNSKVINEDRIYPKLELGTDKLWYCNTQQIEVKPETDRGNNFSYQWFQRNGGEINGSLVAADVVITKPGTFYLQVGNAKNGCLRLDTLNIIVNKDVPEDIILDTYDPLCFGDKNGSIKNISIIGGIEPHVLTVNGVNVQGSILNNLSAGTYEIEVRDNYDCLYTKSFVLEEPELLTVEPIEDITISFNETSSIEVYTNYDDSEIMSITWRDLKGNIVGTGSNFYFDQLMSNTYEVEIININGCSVRTKVNVLVDNEVKFVTSNIIKPGSGSNGKIVIRKNNIPVNILDISIYDRWGSKVYNFEPFYFENSGTVELNWDGTFRGQDLLSGVYIMYIQYEDYFGNRNKIMTDVTLIR